VAHKIIGGGEEGPKIEVRTKEEADHSLPYIIAVALLDGEVLPVQYAPERIQRADVAEPSSKSDSPMGKRYLEDILETMSYCIDSVKFAGGSFTLVPRESTFLRKIRTRFPLTSRNAAISVSTSWRSNAVSSHCPRG
jgi:2-methylcitrate dehydratase MmgE/PrpD-like protein/(2R)-phospho-3-sulfolactate synthase (ComA)